MDELKLIQSIEGVIPAGLIALIAMLAAKYVLPLFFKLLTQSKREVAELTARYQEKVNQDLEARISRVDGDLKSELRDTRAEMGKVREEIGRHANHIAVLNIRLERLEGANGQIGRIQQKVEDIEGRAFLMSQNIDRFMSWVDSQKAQKYEEHRTDDGTDLLKKKKPS